MKKICRVCNDVAISFNFQGLCCDSCFYRRNFSRYNKLTCLNGGQCSITVQTRRFCARCRFEKCLKIGMNHGFSAKHRKNKMLFEVSLGQTTTSSSENSDYEISTKFSEQTSQIVASYNGHCFSLLKEMIHRMVENPFDNWPTAPPSMLGYALNTDQAFNLQAPMIKVMADFVQSVPEFRALPNSDRIQLFRRAFPPMLLLRSIFYFHWQKDGYVCRLNGDDNCAVYTKLDQLYLPEMKHLIEVHRKAAHYVNEVRKNTVIRDLLSVMALWASANGDCKLETNPEYLRYHYTKYLHLWRWHLASVFHDEDQFAKVHGHLLEVIDDLKRLTTNVYQYYANVERSVVVSSVLAEIYEIND